MDKDFGVRYNIQRRSQRRCHALVGLTPHAKSAQNPVIVPSTPRGNRLGGGTHQREQELRLQVADPFRFGYPLKFTNFKWEAFMNPQNKKIRKSSFGVLLPPLSWRLKCDTTHRHREAILLCISPMTLALVQSVLSMTTP